MITMGGCFRDPGYTFLLAATLGLLVAGFLIVLVTPAAAHAGGLSSSDDEPVVLAVQPPVPGLTIRVTEFGARLRLDNDTAKPVVVEPRPGSQLSGLPTVAPGDHAYWSDPRVVTAAAGDRPPSGRLAWSIPLTVGDRSVKILGEQRWPPAPPTLGWWLLIVSMTGFVGLTGILGGTRMWSRIIVAGALAAVLIAHMVHVAGSALVPEDTAAPVVFLSAAGYALLGWPVGVLAIVLILRQRVAGPLLAVVTGALFGLIIAPGDAFTLFDPVVPFAWGAETDRLLISLTVGGGLGVTVAGTAILRRDAHPGASSTHIELAT